MKKRFPSVAEKFDVAKLDRAKVVTLEYAGKRSEAKSTYLAEEGARLSEALFRKHFGLSS
jgi:hypothetical protein